MFVVIDNYDSFTDNLLQYLGILKIPYVKFFNDKITVSELKKMTVSAFIFSPGPGNPKSAGNSLEIVKAFYKQVPMLGICLGHQIIAEAFDGVVAKAPLPKHGKISMVTHDLEGIYKGITNPSQVTRYHSLCITKMPIGFHVTGRAIDDNVIMSIAHDDLPIYGVQYHPEAIMSLDGLAILKNFVKIAKRVNKNAKNNF